MAVHRPKRVWKGGVVSMRWEKLQTTLDELVIRVATDDDPHRLIDVRMTRKEAMALAVFIRNN